jgi:hypothetical protein
MTLKIFAEHPNNNLPGENGCQPGFFKITARFGCKIEAGLQPERTWAKKIPPGRGRDLGEDGKPISH